MVELIHRILVLAFWLTGLIFLFGGSLSGPMMSGVLLMLWQIPRLLFWLGADRSHTPAS